MQGGKTTPTINIHSKIGWNERNSEDSFDVVCIENMKIEDFIMTTKYIYDLIIDGTRILSKYGWYMHGEKLAKFFLHLDKSGALKIESWKILIESIDLVLDIETAFGKDMSSISSLKKRILINYAWKTGNQLHC